jgi:ankyrin repeat protein
MQKEKKKILIQALKTGDLSTIQAFATEDSSWLQSPLDGIMLPINIAAQHGHVDVILFLIETDSSQLNIKDEFEQTPAIWAAANGQADALQLLVTLDADLQCATAKENSEHDGWTPLKWAMGKNHLRCMEILQEAHCQSVRKMISTNSHLLNMSDDTGETLLVKSARLCHIDAVKYLISQGADIHTRHSDMQYHLLHIAAQEGHLSLVQYLHEEVNSHYLDQTDSNGQTAVLWAAANGYLEVVRYLTEKGANLSLSTNGGPHKGKTPIHWAIENGHHEIVFFLIVTLSIHQQIQTLFPYIQDAQVAIKLMGHNASFVPLLLDDIRIYELIHASTCCEITERLIDAYEPATARSPSRYRRIDKSTGQSIFFSPIDPPLGEGSYGMVRRLANTSGETLAVKSNKSDFSIERIEDELKFMQKAYPASNVYRLFSFTRNIRDKKTQHYRYIMPDRKGEDFEVWATKEKSPYRLAQVISLIADELYRLHEIQIIHGDLIPYNILVSITGDEYAIYFVDFGFTYASNGKMRTISSNSTDTRYPPERKNNSTKPSPRQDIYMLGTTFKTILFSHPSYDNLRLNYPSIHTFIIQSINNNPEHRPSLKKFCDTLKKEISDATILAQHQVTKLSV